MTEWKATTLRNKIHIKHGYPFKGEFFSDEGEFIVLTPGNFYEEGGFKRQTGNEKYYLGEFPKSYLHKKGDLIVAMTEQAEGLLGSCAIVPEDNQYLHNQRLGLITVNENEVNKMFIYHLFRTNYIRKQFRLTSTGSKVKHTSPDRIYDLKVELPSITTQEKIAGVLSSIDAKLILNKEIIGEIDTITKSIYDYWFVQFDFPDENSNPYKSSGGRMGWNDELNREIPDSWQVKNLSEVIDRIATGLNPRQNFTLGTGSNFYVTTKNIDYGKLSLDDSCDKIDDEALEKINIRSELKSGDVLFTSIVPVGRTYLIQDTPDNWNINESLFTIRPDADQITSEYLLMLLSGDELNQFAKNVSVGSIFKGIRIEVLSNYKLAHSSLKLIKNFSLKVAPLLQRMRLIEKEYHQLTKLRDWLLPMLMNGQVKVQ